MSLRAGILVWEGVELLDIAGPGEVFAVAGFEVVTLAETLAPVISQGFLKLEPEHDFAGCPPLDVLVVPGGNTDEMVANPALLDCIRSRCAQTPLVLSVCTGALVLAAAGLLDGLEATTWHGAVERLQEFAPGTTVHADRRWVDAGQVVTAAGVSAGIDASLHVVSRLLGEETARRVAQHIEYPAGRQA